ncbi:hypothetical protein [Pediococcus pentosaceus]|uniref:Uncharacterized protein n=1 Tax=Pediococcus pentosaceus TaxID=1255 RepID=A0ABD7X4X6_PEDPE|nr:hypothetical protein [Pediococcus pentosaceus]MBF7110765.1 hypothetical protein [Pediococcus pentosaceus]MBF7117738.1 hypothetical protein [Pediococcus pentosaceus]MDN4853846.1 hypothetical protein [Pediococcus pentosaceus]WEA56822.1 hypothetical protein PWB86_06390 [Pediococcus pentosaceus]WRI50208.1 hypothetical protein PSR64_04735 [Pediococcus pentosaceus]
MTKEELETENQELKEKVSNLEFTNKVLEDLANVRIQKISDLEVANSTLKIKINGGK